jgi:hypothetical protein
LLAHFIPFVAFDLWLGAYVLFTLCVHLAWSRVSLIVLVIISMIDRLSLQTLRPRRGPRAGQDTASFFNVYGLSASLPEKYGAPEWLFSAMLGFTSKICYPEWSGTVGVTLGFFCGIALVCSPLAVVYLSL